MSRWPEPRACYVHIPFCARVCPYCDFAVVAGRTDEAGRYVDAVVKEILRDDPAAPLESVFVGGGTPSSIPAGMVGEILRTLNRHHGIAPGAEISIESNPEDLSSPVLQALVAEGVNRISIGAQSFDPNVLEALGRVHSPGHVLRAVEDAKAAGFQSVSVDLIFGHPEETEESWRASLSSAVSSGVDHVSTYALTVEKGTALSRAIAAGAQGPDDDAQADRYEVAMAALRDAGLEQYEVSNHAVPGHRCRYNMDVWKQRPYVAYGLGAHGFRDGVRSRNVRRLDAYLYRVESGDSPRQGEEVIAGWAAEIERLMVGLRLAEGVVAGDGGAAFLASAAGRRFLGAGVVSIDDGVLKVEQPLLTDMVTREVLSVSPPDRSPSGRPGPR